MAGGRKRERLRKKMATAVAGTPAGAGGQQSSPAPRWALRVRALSAALRGHRAAAGGGGLPRVDFLRRLYESVVFHLLWVIESAVVLATLCFFFLRFGFRL